MGRLWKRTDNVATQQQERKTTLDSKYSAAEMMSKSPSAAAALSISCTCTECTTFLRPMLPSRSHYPRNFSHLISPTTTTLPHAQIPVWIGKLSLAAYDAQTSTRASTPRITNPTDSQQQLSIITSTTNTTTNIRSAYPKTPGTFRCASSYCRTRIPFTSLLATTTRLRKKPLCDKHGEQSFDAEEHHGQMERDAASAHSADISDRIDSYACSGVESPWGSNNGDGATRPDLGGRTSSLASWGSLASLESDDAGVVWDAMAFDSKLCW